MKKVATLIISCCTIALGNKMLFGIVLINGFFIMSVIILWLILNYTFLNLEPKV